ncbi:MAG: hypothetical protein LC667_14685, partial [Thioalkalivibrio sp.]|nr:hypothetical protein [Thioalkalivibrio sp.]
MQPLGLGEGRCSPSRTIGLCQFYRRGEAIGSFGRVPDEAVEVIDDQVGMAVAVEVNPLGARVREINSRET